MNIDELGTIL